MRICSIQPEPIDEVPFLNAGRRPGQFHEDRLPILRGEVDRLPEGVDAVIATSDLQGRQFGKGFPARPLPLLGETLPALLEDEILPRHSLPPPQRVGVFLAGDFFTLPALDRRGGTGDVTEVWRAFGARFAWTAGVAGNHDTFGPKLNHSPRFSGNLHFLDGGHVCLGGLQIAGLGGIIGNPKRVWRRTHDDYVSRLGDLLQQPTDVLLTHDGPNAPEHNLRGDDIVREVVERWRPNLVIRGHDHWKTPFVELGTGVQVLNVDARVVILQ